MSTGRRRGWIRRRGHVRNALRRGDLEPLPGSKRGCGAAPPVRRPTDDDRGGRDIREVDAWCRRRKYGKIGAFCTASGSMAWPSGGHKTRQPDMLRPLPREGFRKAMFGKPRVVRVWRQRRCCGNLWGENGFFGKKCDKPSEYNYLQGILQAMTADPLKSRVYAKLRGLTGGASL